MKVKEAVQEWFKTQPKTIYPDALQKLMDWQTKWTEKQVKVKVKVSLCLTKHHTMKIYWGWRYSTSHLYPWLLNGLFHVGKDHLKQGNYIEINYCVLILSKITTLSLILDVHLYKRNCKYWICSVEKRAQNVLCTIMVKQNLKIMLAWWVPQSKFTNQANSTKWHSNSWRVSSQCRHATATFVKLNNHNILEEMSGILQELTPSSEQ